MCNNYLFTYSKIYNKILNILFVNAHFQQQFAYLDIHHFSN